MLVGNFPEEYILKLHKGTITDNFEVVKGMDYFQKAIGNYESFLEEGLGIVFSGFKSSIVATMLVYLMLSEDYSVPCKYLDGNRPLEQEDMSTDILVLDCTQNIIIPMVENILQFREKKVLSTLLCIPNLEYLSSSPELGEVLGYNGGFKGEVFRGIEVLYKYGDDRWKNLESTDTNGKGLYLKKDNE